jgi:hypothetical protein
MRHAGSVEYEDFCKYCIGAVVGKRRFNKFAHIEPLSKWVTISDEAFAILLFENSVDRWTDMAKSKVSRDSKIKPKYTNGGKSKNKIGSSRKYEGWSVEGYERFNELYVLVQENRQAECAEDFEVLFQGKCKADFLKNKKNKDTTEKAALPPRKRVMIAHSLWQETEARRPFNNGGSSIGKENELSADSESGDESGGDSSDDGSKNHFRKTNN